MSSGSRLHRIARALILQMDLYRQLASVEWKEEKVRLTGMLVSLLLGFIFLFCLLLVLSSIVLVLSWYTRYRILALSALVIFYGLGALISWYRFKSLGNRLDQAFSDTRDEMAADIALFCKKMDQ